MTPSSRRKSSAKAQQLSAKERRALVNQKHYEKNAVHIRKQKREYMRKKRAQARLTQEGGERGRSDQDSEQPIGRDHGVERDQDLYQSLEEEIELLKEKFRNASDLAAERQRYIIDLQARVFQLSAQATDVADPLDSANAVDGEEVKATDGGETKTSEDESVKIEPLDHALEKEESEKRPRKRKRYASQCLGSSQGCSIVTRSLD